MQAIGGGNTQKLKLCDEILFQVEWDIQYCFTEIFTQSLSAEAPKIYQSCTIAGLGITLTKMSPDSKK